jgi:phosphotransferase system enzyme I (PtsI)
MAGDPLLVVLLIGLGFRAFSMSPGAIPMVKRGLAALDSRVAIDLARRARRARSAEEVNALLAPVGDSMHGAVGVT